MTDKQKAWIDYYKQGNSPAKSAELAGYRVTNKHSLDIIGAENLKKLGSHIIDRDDILSSDRVADMEEINSFWTDVMRDQNNDMKDRIKASELRAKAAGGFVEKIDVHGSVDTNVTKLDSILDQLKE